MNWTILIIAAVVIAALFAMKRATFVSVDVARKCLATGAVVVDVRSPEEFGGGHVSGAINIPLGDLRNQLPQQIPDKNKPLLLHCLSGGRSAIGARYLKDMGYTNVFNLGSIGRARLSTCLLSRTSREI